MVSTLYRTHKALQPQFKVPSLYAFDALARAARGHATKHGFAGDSQPGNSATFLLKLEAILEGLFRDMMGSDVPEGKVSKTHTVTLLSHLGEFLVLVVTPSTGLWVGLSRQVRQVHCAKERVPACPKVAPFESELPEFRVAHFVARYNERITRSIAALTI